jgi:hypothetical protein
MGILKNINNSNIEFKFLFVKVILNFNKQQDLALKYT